MKKIYLTFTFICFLTLLKSQLCFNPTPSYSVPAQPNFVTGGDFNNDSKIDLVTADFGANKITVLLGNGLGTFTSSTNFNVGINPYSIALADYNGDSKLDIAVCNQGWNNVSVLLGNGLGGFTSATNFTVASYPSSIVSADFNNDGKKDLATAHSYLNSVSILLGVGNGSFLPFTNYASGLAANPITTSDFNTDGNMDLATCGGGSIHVLYGNGAGGFSAPSFFSIGGSGNQWITSADFSTDGKADIAVVNGVAGKVCIFLGNGTGGFSPGVNYSPLANPFSIISSDLNNDGKLDIAASDLGVGGGTLSILFGDGAGSFTAEANFPVGIQPRSLFSGDFNGDGKNDLASSNYGSDNVSILLNSATPSLNISSTASAVCFGDSTALYVGGVSTYTWSTMATGTVNIVTPSVTTTYSVKGTSSFGCTTDTTTINILVNPNPIITTVSSSDTLCIGETATLTANGANSYTWTLVGVGQSVFVSPTSNTTYTVIGTDINGCLDTAGIMQITSACVGIHELTVDNFDVKVFPNPTSGILHILSVENFEGADIEIFNALGQIVAKETFAQKIDVSNFPNGFYSIKITPNEYHKYHSRFIKE